VRERGDEQVAVAKVNERQRLGTFADLLNVKK